MKIDTILLIFPPRIESVTYGIFLCKKSKKVYNTLDQCFPTSAPGTKSAPKTSTKCSQNIQVLGMYLKLFPETD